MVVDKEPSSCLVTIVSNKAMVPRDSFSIVNWIEGSMEFKWWCNACICSSDRANRVSSVYLCQNNDLWVQVESALSSTSYITRSATLSVNSLVCLEVLDGFLFFWEKVGRWWFQSG